MPGNFLKCFEKLLMKAHIYQSRVCLFFFRFFKKFYFYFILLYNTVLVLPYIDMNPPQVYMSSQFWTPSHLSPYIISLFIPVHQPQASCIEPRLVINVLHDSIHVSYASLPKHYFFKKAKTNVIEDFKWETRAIGWQLCRKWIWKNIRKRRKILKL